jgi:hypothetical protein
MDGSSSRTRFSEISHSQGNEIPHKRYLPATEDIETDVSQLIYFPTVSAVDENILTLERNASSVRGKPLWVSFAGLHPA